MQKEITLPFTWEDWYQQDVLALSFNNVTFTEDFGVFKNGENIDCITVNYGEGIIESYKENGDVLKTQSFKGIAI